MVAVERLGASACRSERLPPADGQAVGDTGGVGEPGQVRVPAAADNRLGHAVALGQTALERNRVPGTGSEDGSPCSAVILLMAVPSPRHALNSQDA